MTTKIKWRLAERPTPTEISLLVEKELLTKDEAREILFSQETTEDRDKKSLEDEIKFLREMVDKLAKGSTTRIIETIREVPRYYYNQPWYQPYATWCTSQTNLTSAGLQSGAQYTLSNQATSMMTSATTASLNFKDINTF